MDATNFIYFFEKPTIAVCKKCRHFCHYHANGMKCSNCGSRDFYTFTSEDYEEGE